jgi:hypothetical protein
MRLRFLLVSLIPLALWACSGSDDESVSNDPDSGVGGMTSSGGAAGESSTTGGASGTAGEDAGEDAGKPSVKPCGCLLGEGAYCAARAKAEAEAAGCKIGALAGNAGNLLKCENDEWSVLDDCTGTCKFTASSTKLDDHCELPVCDCFVEVAWCGTGAAKEADAMGCRIPLLPEHDGDILYCPGGKWTVKQNCQSGCIESPKGTPDACKGSSDYRLPYDCNDTHTCSNGNHTNTHTGNDEYAYDFQMPVGTTLRAMRGGKVLRVRNPSPPGSACYNGGSTSCANFANTVEILHSDGSVGLYMHLSKTGVSTGANVNQGDVIGKSGQSGWVTGPHVHVQVQSNCGIWWCQSKPFHFVEKASISSGSSCTSDNC